MSDNAQMRESAQEEQKPAVIADVIMQAIAEEEKCADTPSYISGRVRLAKASQADLDAAYRIMSLLDCMDDGYYPSNEEGSPTFFDSDDWEHLQFLHQQIIEIAEHSGGICRVIGAAGILLNEQNGLIDPDDDCIELHPDLKAMIAAGEEVEALRARVAELESELAAARTAPEPIQCETCQGTGKINEMLGGYSFSDPSATCPDCDGSGELESIHDFRAGQWWVKELDGILGSPSPDVTPDQKRAVAVVHNLLRHVANLGRVTAQAALTPEQAEKADEAVREALGFKVRI